MGSAKQSQKNENCINSHMNSAYFAVKHGLSFQKYPLICKLQ